MCCMWTAVSWLISENSRNDIAVVILSGKGAASNRVRLSESNQDESRFSFGGRSLFLFFIFHKNESPQSAHVGAYRIRPNASTYPRRCFQGVCDTSLHGNWVKCRYSFFIKRKNSHEENCMDGRGMCGRMLVELRRIRIG